jgi:hypothetical protein
MKAKGIVLQKKIWASFDTRIIVNFAANRLGQGTRYRYSVIVTGTEELARNYISLKREKCRNIRK